MPRTTGWSPNGTDHVHGHWRTTVIGVVRGSSTSHRPTGRAASSGSRVPIPSLVGHSDMASLRSGLRRLLAHWQGHVLTSHENSRIWSTAVPDSESTAVSRMAVYGLTGRPPPSSLTGIGTQCVPKVVSSRTPMQALPPECSHRPLLEVLLDRHVAPVRNVSTIRQPRASPRAVHMVRQYPAGGACTPAVLQGLNSTARDRPIRCRGPAGCLAPH